MTTLICLSFCLMMVTAVSGGLIANVLNKLIGGSVSSDPCKNFPCQHDCTKSGKTFQCSCGTGFKVSASDPTRCEAVRTCDVTCLGCGVNNQPVKCSKGYQVSAKDPTKCEVIPCTGGQADVIFVIDSSGSIGASNYRKNFDLANNIIRRTTLGPQGYQFGVLIYSTTVEVLLKLSDLSAYNQFEKALSNPKYMNGKTYTGDALEYLVNNNLYGSKYGGRSAARKIAIVITDGKSQDSAKTKRSAAALKKSGVLVVVVGVGKDCDMDELQDIASSDDLIFQVANYATLGSIENALVQLTCKPYTPSTDTSSSNSKSKDTKDLKSSKPGLGLFSGGFLTKLSAGVKLRN